MIEQLVIADLPSLPLVERASLPNIPAVYFAVDSEGAVLYIGRTRSLFNRWASQHARRGQLEEVGNVRIAWLATEEDRLCETERAAIARFNPRLNWSDVPVVNGRVVRIVRFPPHLDQWLQEEAKRIGAGSVQSVVRLILHKRMRQEQAA